MRLTREKYIFFFLNFKLFLIFLDFYK